MLVIADDLALRNLSDGPLQALLQQRTEELNEEADGGWTELVRFVALQPGDSLEVLNAELGFPILEQPFELIEEHAAWFEMVFVLSDDGVGVEVFIPKAPGVDSQLLARCAAYALPAAEHDPP
jgi:hypothetical protein